MSKVTADMVKELRERTGVGMGKCKEALDACAGDMEKAIDHLRKAGMASSVKKEGRDVNEGLISYAESAHAATLVEVNSETDFVAQNDIFKGFIKDVAQDAADSRPASLGEFLQQVYSKDSSLTIDQLRAITMQRLGENIQLKRLVVLPKSSDISIGIYSHMGGKIITVVTLNGGSGNEAFARELAMHVAAEAPEYLHPKDIPEAALAREQDIAKDQVKDKPANIVDKIVEGKIKAYYDQVCLLCQKYIKDNAFSVADVVAAEAKKQGKEITVQSFMRWKVGG
ncbi:MAG: translation elongation factor Ts [Chlamydiae bacterium]|nr:translation elongation factor Ts [Chlamydiota bacterium]